MGLFGRNQKKSSREQVREWNSKLRKEGLLLDRQIRGIMREQEKVKISLKQAAKKGDRDTCVILAKEMVRARKAIGRINTSKAQINSVMLNMNQQLANLRVAGALSKSTAIMESMQDLVKVTEISHSMQELSREMMKAGIIDEMLNETIDEATNIDEEDMEEEVQAEVDKILFDLTEGQLGKAPPVVSTLPANKEKEKEKVKVKEEEPEEDEEEITEMRKRLEALRS